LKDRERLATDKDARSPVKDHVAPVWFRDAKLGIFVHWGAYSVPGWAPPTGLFSDAAALGWENWFKLNPYAEWYANTMKIEGSPTAEHHQARYGDAPYSCFGAQFSEAVRDWNPQEMAELFQRSGARYVIPTTKHHDGFCLWPSDVPNPNLPEWHTDRDLMGELASAVRERDLRFGVYYSGGLDWSWNPQALLNQEDVHSTFPQSDDFIAYVDRQWRELIDRYQPDVLWNDIGTPANQDVDALFRDYLQRVPEGAINNRFRQRDGEGTLTATPPFDFTTPEYSSESKISPVPFETCRGIGYSFGYNQLEDESTYVPIPELIHFFIDIVSKNGNLLLNVGPKADGTIPAGQIERLEALGGWLATHGEAIYGTRPWSIAEGKTLDGTPVRFTSKPGTLFANVLTEATPGSRGIGGLRLSDRSTVHLLGQDEPLVWSGTESGFAYTLPESLPQGVAYSLKITPVPDRD
jgi:alpha-L-fucosidase